MQVDQRKDGTQRTIYLERRTIEQAQQILEQHFGRLAGTQPETVPTIDAVGRILAQPVSANISSPHFHAAAMDGFAVAAEETFGAHPHRPLRLSIGASAHPVNTGYPLPDGCNAVIMIENVHGRDEASIEIEAPAFPWQHVRKMGEDIVATELLFARHHKITPYCVGALLAGGVFEVSVRQPARVLIIATGSELVDWQTSEAKDIKPGQVLETNSFVLGKMVESAGGTWHRHPPVGDNADAISNCIESGVAEGYDMLLTIGGSSAGSEDYIRQALEQAGQVLFHGVTMMPGKPLLAGKVGQTPVFGMPGYPVSTIMAFEQLVLPLLYQLQGRAPKERVHRQVHPTRKIASKLGVEEFVRVKLGSVRDRIVATPLARGAGLITSLTEATGIIRVAHHLEGVPAFEPVDCELLKPADAIEHTIVMVGSHDNSLDILADELRRHPQGWHLTSSHVGSMGGLMAVKQGLCHLAGSHLLDPETGIYNQSYIQRYLKTKSVCLINLVLREQGLIVAKGNPKKIKGIEDLTRQEVRMINRQQGSGTRVLLDHSLQQQGIDPDTLNGYENEEFTHMAVAAAVLSGAADAGMGIFAAAKALDLEFVPMVQEQYDLVIPVDLMETAQIQTLLETIETSEFHRRVQALGGYSTTQTGTEKPIH